MEIKRKTAIVDLPLLAVYGSLPPSERFHVLLRDSHSRPVLNEAQSRTREGSLLAQHRQSKLYRREQVICRWAIKHLTASSSLNLPFKNHVRRKLSPVVVSQISWAGIIQSLLRSRSEDSSFQPRETNYHVHPPKGHPYRNRKITLGPGEWVNKNSHKVAAPTN